MFKLPQGAMRWLVPALVGILCFGLLAPPGVRADTDLELGGTATVAYANGDAVRLRAAPGTDAEVLALLPEGSTVAVLDGPVSADDGAPWYQVGAADATGYVAAEFLAAASSEAAATGDDVASDDVASDDAASDDATAASADVSAAADATGQTATTTSSLNLRGGPGLSDAVLTVMPLGATVTITGGAQNGFYPVTYDRTGGWASADYLAVGGDAGAAPTPSGDAATVSTALNLRSGPSTADAVLTLMPAGAIVGLTGESANGFLGVTYAGRTGWASAAFLDTGGSTPTPPSEPSPATGTAVATTALNLRSGPSTGDAVITVMPAGSTVTLTGDSSNGFLSVAYGGREGWASAAYLDTDGETAPPDEDTGTAVGTAVVTSALNLRSGPGTANAVITVMAAGSTVTITGDPQGGFSPVTYDGRSGWASGDYLDTDGSGTAPTPPTAPAPGGGGIVWPFESAAAWEVIQGYNGGTHQNRDALAQYYYALDLARVDGNTAGQAVLSPVNGTIRWVDAPSGGIAIDMGNGYVLAMFHVTFLPSLASGQTVGQGQYLGQISGPGGAGYAAVPHVDMTLWQSTDGGLRSRVASPYVGSNAISGTSFPDTGGANQHGGTVFYP